ncbi:PREDICTED: alpha/beta hydrolase domain-containing protein 11 isoform X4 [Propithecus coquereli]|uniref:alpha/beta hydrolase domain-containing protein 11 isoform X4 n=1 Tax=Propithecus coquereli TaxID=379532 RepID=UPI00063FB4F4|nr:PREDICTED: alpha/beta hydrolase domain-containing protein 11 isoform X4 [Propithecus coquereli]
MLRWARAWRLPHGGLCPSGSSFSRVPVAPSSSCSREGAEPRPLPLSYKLLDGESALPAVVFLHGLLGSKTNFNSIAKALAEQTGRRVLTVDARNHGDSPHSPDMSYEAMSQDLQGLLPQLGLVPCVLIGHSMGGKTAMLLALQRPELVERLVAVDISPVETTSSSNFESIVTAMRAIDIPDEMPRSHARKLADGQLSSVVQAPTGHSRAAVAAHQPGGGRWALHVEGELGCLGPAPGQDHGFPTATGLLPRANPLPPWWKLRICASQPPP